MPTLQLVACPDVLAVSIAGQRLAFLPVALTFLEHGLTDVFAHKNNKTVRESLAHRRYAKFAKLIAAEYLASIDQPLGTFLITLKRSGDSTYKQFLNPYGDGVYCRFRMERGPLSTKKGLYCYCVDSRIVYVGRSIDPFEKRLNQGYGTIHPKNCFLDGQATNCHLNALVAESVTAVSFHVCPLTDDAEIYRLERLLIQTLKPNWNIALK